jgi:TonB-linked SusC/RagA family outer membrane protein
LDNLLKWNKTFGIQTFDLTLLQNAEKYQRWNTKANNEQFSPNDILGFHNLKGGTNPTVDSTDEMNTGAAYMARLNYSLMDKYIITGTFRRDGYSAFGQMHPWANFGSGAIAWRFTGEEFWTDNLLNILEHGKLRASYGTNGNRDIGMYNAISDLNTSGKYWYANATTGAIYQRSQMYVNRMQNKNLKWESTSALNFGLDFTFHRQIVDGSIEVYTGKTTNLLVQRALPDILGFSNVWDNLGEVQNYGYELTLNTNNIRKENLTWRTTFNFSRNVNKIKKLYGTMVDVLDENGNVIGQKEADDTKNKWFIGRSIRQVWELQPSGVWQLGQEEEAAKYGVAPGDFRIYDPNGDHKFEDSDKQFLGQTDPKFRWTLRNEFTFLKDFNLSFMMYSNWGQLKEYNRPKNNSGFKDRSTDYVLPYWTPDNPINTHARIYSSNGSANYNMFWDNSFIRLDNISLAYTVPAKLTQKAAIQNLKLYFTVRNVAVWTKKWEFWDPENNGPTPRTFTFGLNMTL